MGVLRTCLSVHYILPGAQGVQKTLGPLDPELQILVRCCVVLKGQSWVLWESSQGAKPCGAVTLVLNLLVFYLS